MRIKALLSISVLFFSALSFSVLWGPEAGASPSQADNIVELDKVIAIVNKEVITWAELYRAMEFEFGQKTGFMSEEEKRRFLAENEKGYLSRMIEITLQLQEAQRLGVGVEEAEINEAIGSIRKKYSMDEGAFADALRSEGFSIEEYRRRLGEQIIISKLVSKEVREKLVVSEEEARKFLDDKGMKREEGEGYRISRIFFAAPAGQEEKTALEEKARELVSKLRAGGDFHGSAAEYSAASSDLGLIGREALAREFLEVLDGLKPGDVSEPFWAGKALNILKLDEKIMPDAKGALQKARRELMEKRFEAEYQTWLRQLREKSFIEIRL